MDQALETDQYPEALAPPSTTESITAILVAFEESSTALMGRTDTLAIECCLIQEDLDKICGRFSTAESRISSLEDKTVVTSQSLMRLQRTVKTLMSRLEDAENRLCHNNVWVEGL